MKKIYMNKKIILSIVLIVATIISFIMIKTTVYGALQYVRFRNGNIEIQFRDKQAQSDVIYRTVGWTIHEKEAPNRNAVNTQKYGVMYGEDIQQIREESMGDGTVITDFLIDVDRVEEAMVTADMLQISQGGTVYLDAIFEVRNRKTGAKISGPHYTYDQIVNAAPWGSQTKEDLKDHYNIPVSYMGKKYPIYKKYIVNGEVYREELLSEEYPGTIVESPPFEPKITLPNGQIAVLTESYTYNNLVKNKKYNVVHHDEEGNPITVETHGIEEFVSSIIEDKETQEKMINSINKNFEEGKMSLTIRINNPQTKEEKLYTIFND